MGGHIGKGACSGKGLTTRRNLYMLLVEAVVQMVCSTNYMLLLLQLVLCIVFCDAGPATSQPAWAIA